MTPDIEIYDTTLRDGSQGEGVSFSVADKLRVAERLDAFGVHYIEGGWPGSNPKDIEFFEQAKRRTFKHARLAAFGSTRRKGVRVEDDEQVRLLLEADTPVVTIFGKTWLLHVREVLQTTPEENLAMVEDTVRHLKAARHASSSTTPSTRSTATRTIRCTRWPPGGRPSAAGADVVALCDTNGGSMPAEDRRDHRGMPARSSAFGSAFTPTTTSGLAVANALAVARCRRHARAGHAQRLRRACRQLQPDDAVIPNVAVQAEAAVGACRVAAAC